MILLSEQNIFIFLIQIFLLLGLSRGFGELFSRFKQPPLTAEILVGVLLGPTVFGRFLPALQQTIFPVDAIQQSMLETVAWLGILFLLLVAGLEIDFTTAWRQRGDALKIALTGVFVPIAIGFCCCLLLPDRYLAHPDQRIFFSFFMATVMSITAMAIVTRTLHDLSLSKTDLGFLIMSALSVNDIIGWLIFTVILGLFTQVGMEIPRVITTFVLAMGFLIFCLTAGRKLTNILITTIKRKQLPEPGASLTFICLLGLFCGAVTQKIGIQALFGFLVAGIMAGEVKALSERTRQVISQMVFAIFVPLFFASIGLKIDFIQNFDVGIILFVTLVGIMGKFFGAWLGARLTKLPKAEHLPMAIAHIPGGTMEIVVGMLALKHHLITEPVFEAIVFGAIVSSMLVGPWLAYSLKKRKEISVLEFFSRRGIIERLKAHTRDEVIEELCYLAVEQDNVPSVDILIDEVLKRENTMGTAIEEGVAVPHARLFSIRRPIVIFGRSLAGIDWNSPDGKPTSYIFLILTPQADSHIQVQILGFIAKLMSDEHTRENIRRAQDAVQIWERLQRALTAAHIRSK